MPSRLGHVACPIRESTPPLQIASSGAGSRASEFADFEDEEDEEDHNDHEVSLDDVSIEDVDAHLPVTGGLPIHGTGMIPHSPIAIPPYSPITMPSHMRLACVKRRRSAVGCSQQSDSVPTSRRRPSEPCEATSASQDRLPSADTTSPVPKTSSSRKELSMIWYLLQHLCSKYDLSNRVLVRAQKTLIEQYRQQKRARNLALAACCCIIYACERYNIVAPDLQQAVDFCTRALAAARSDNGARVNAGSNLPPSPPAVRMSFAEQQLLRQRVSERRTIIQEMVERANRRLRRAAAAASASEESSEEDLLSGGVAATSGAIQAGTCPQCLQVANGPGVFGSSPDSTISAVSAIGCASSVNSSAPCECEGNLRVQARTKRPCLMSCGTQIRRVGWRLEKNIEAEFESFQTVQGFALNLAALAAAVAATGASTPGTPDGVLRPATAAIDIGTHGHVDDVNPFDDQLFDSWRRRSRSDAVSC